MVGEGETGEEKLLNTGFEMLEEDGDIKVDFVEFDSPAQKAGLEDFQVIQELMVPKSSLPKELMYLPALGLLYLLWKSQTARRRRTEESEPKVSNNEVTV